MSEEQPSPNTTIVVAIVGVARHPSCPLTLELYQRDSCMQDAHVKVPVPDGVVGAFGPMLGRRGNVSWKEGDLSELMEELAKVTDELVNSQATCARREASLSECNKRLQTAQARQRDSHESTNRANAQHAEAARERDRLQQENTHLKAKLYKYEEE